MKFVFWFLSVVSPVHRLFLDTFFESCGFVWCTRIADCLPCLLMHYFLLVQLLCLLRFIYALWLAFFVVILMNVDNMPKFLATKALRCSGGIIVNPNENRFVNVVSAMKSQEKDCKFYLILNQQSADVFGFVYLRLFLFGSSLVWCLYRKYLYKEWRSFTPLLIPVILLPFMSYEKQSVIQMLGHALSLLLMSIGYFAQIFSIFGGGKKKTWYCKYTSVLLFIRIVHWNVSFLRQDALYSH